MTKGAFKPVGLALGHAMDRTKEGAMSEWKKTSCVLCFNNCGLEVITEGSKILKVKADRDRGHLGLQVPEEPAVRVHH